MATYGTKIVTFGCEYTRDRLGEELRAVGFHSDETFEVRYVRDDSVAKYPSNRVARFIETSRNPNRNLQYLDEERGVLEASLHVLEEGLITQRHSPGDDVIVFSMEEEVGRNFTRVVRDCIDHMN